MISRLKVLQDFQQILKLCLLQDESMTSGSNETEEMSETSEEDYEMA